MIFILYILFAASIGSLGGWYIQGPLGFILPAMVTVLLGALLISKGLL